MGGKCPPQLWYGGYWGDNFKESAVLFTDLLRC